MSHARLTKTQLEIQAEVMYWLEVKFIYFLAMQAHKVSKNLIGTFALEHSLHSHLQLFPQSLTAACLPPTPAFTKSTPHGNVVYQMCTPVDLLYQKVETAAV